MKHKIYNLLLLIFLLCASSSFVVNADVVYNANHSETVDTPETTSTIETTDEETTAVTEAQPVTTTVSTSTVNKTVKVNKTFKVEKVLKLNTFNSSLYNFVTSNSKVATVSSLGVVKGLKKGSAVITVTSKTNGSVFAKVNVTVKNRYNSSQLRLMSAIIYSEASGESYAGKKAVGIVIMNRINSKKFPNTLAGVIYQRGQFSPARNGSLNKSLYLYDQGKLNKKCIKAAKATLNGDTQVTYKKRVINMNGYLFFSRYIPNYRLKIQRHQFR